MNLDMTKIANVILYMLDKKVEHLNDKKLSILLFLMDYKHQNEHKTKIFGETYIKNSRSPEPKILSEIFDMIANEEDYNDEDEKIFLIEELFDFLDIEVLPKDTFVELKFLKVEEEFDSEIFSKEELKTIREIVKDYKNTTPRNLANETFKLDIVRNTQKGEIII